jgi:ABC-type sulfate transport system permease component
MDVIFGSIGLFIAMFWIALPFLVNATNTRLDKLIAEVGALRIAVEGKKAFRASESGDA